MTRHGRLGAYSFRFFAAVLLLAVPVLTMPVRAEDGYDLWLRYRPMEASAQAPYRPLATAIVSEGTSPSLDVAKTELIRGLGGLLDRPVGAGAVADGAIVIGTPTSSPLIAALKLPLNALGKGKHCEFDQFVSCVIRKSQHLRRDAHQCRALPRRQDNEVRTARRATQVTSSGNHVERRRFQESARAPRITGHQLQSDSQAGPGIRKSMPRQTCVGRLGQMKQLSAVALELEPRSQQLQVLA